MLGQFFRGIPGGDAGELVAEACLGGVAHPPGYPLHLLLTRAAAMASRGVLTPAHAANFVSCLLGAGAAALLTETVHVVTGSWAMGSGAVAGITFSLSDLVWLYSSGSEVFALNNFLCCLCVHAAARFFAANNPSCEDAVRRWRRIGVFCCALALTNQHTAVLFVAPLAAIVLAHSLPTTGLEWFKLFLIGLLGLSPYAYLPFAVGKPGSWGNAATLDGFLTHIMRSEYGTFSLSPMKGQSEGMVERIALYGGELINHMFGVPLLAIATIGFPAWMMKQGASKRLFGGCLVACLLTYTVVFHALANLPLSSPMPFEVHRRFWMQPSIIVAICTGIGMQHLVSTAASFWKKPLAAFLISGFLAGAAFAGLPSRFSFMSDFSRDASDLFQKYGAALLQDVEDGALLISATDINWNSMRYLQACEGVRPDIQHVSFQILPFPWFKEQHKLYKGIVFPDILPGVSMDKRSDNPGHRRFVTRFLEANVDFLLSS